MSLSEIAEISGVSISTVSRVINNDPRISDGTRERIRRIVAAKGYVPRSYRCRNGRQKPLVRGVRTGNIAMVEVGDNVHGAPLSSEILRGATIRLAEYGMNMLSAYVQDGVMPPCLAMRQVDGVIVRGIPSRGVAAQLCAFPSIWISSRHTPWGDYVVGGHDAGGRLAAQYLLNRGHRRLAFLNPWADHPAFRAKAEGFEFAATKAGSSVDLLDPEPEQGRYATESDMADYAKVEEFMAPLVDRLLAMAPRPTGLFVPADMFAAILYRLLNKRDIKPGLDFEVISANNEGPYLAGLYPRPATIDIGGTRIGQFAVDQLLVRIQRPEEKRGLRIVVEPLVIEGESVNHEANVSWR